MTTYAEAFADGREQGQRDKPDWDLENDALRRENEHLRAALKPFANVADWMDTMLALDRYVSMRGVTFYAESSATGGGFTLGENEFRVARAALSQK